MRARRPRIVASEPAARLAPSYAPCAPLTSARSTLASRATRRAPRSVLEEATRAWRRGGGGADSPNKDGSWARRHRPRRAIVVAAVTAGALLLGAAGLRAELPRVASINLCADQLVLALAEPEQLLSVSWLAADPHESMLAERTAGVPLNYGTAEELIRFDPDVVIAGTLTGDFTRALLARLGVAVVELPPADTLEGIEDNLRLVAGAIGQTQRGEALVRDMRRRVREMAEARPARPIPAVVVRPGGFTVGRGMLAHELMVLAGLRNVAAERGLDRWGSLSMETLLASAPELVVLADYRAHEASLAHAVLEHPALARLTEQVRTVTVPAALWACGLPRSLDSVALLRGRAP